MKVNGPTNPSEAAVFIPEMSDSKQAFLPVALVRRLHAAEDTVETTWVGNGQIRAARTEDHRLTEPIGQANQVEMLGTGTSTTTTSMQGILITTVITMIIMGDLIISRTNSISHPTRA
mmetsp:Transcript_17682/g.51471  ORF Transcript_17682/g.51471 Transcript_17682/m.51471 type:complete len:118 (+) Transcript_17682:586-939(+)